MEWPKLIWKQYPQDHGLLSKIHKAVMSWENLAPKIHSVVFWDEVISVIDTEEVAKENMFNQKFNSVY